jgi:hypothetical protein
MEHYLFAKNTTSKYVMTNIRPLFLEKTFFVAKTYQLAIVIKTRAQISIRYDSFANYCGCMETQSPVARIKFNKFDPIIFSEQMVSCRWFAAIVTIKISGTLVRRANRENSINISDILKRYEIW